MKLIYKSQGIPIAIEKYISSYFNYDQWVISDEYAKVAIGNEYRIIITSLVYQCIVAFRKFNRNF